MPTSPRLNPVDAHKRARLLPDWVRHLDSAVGSILNEQRSHGPLDSGYRRLSRAADRGRLWFAIAGGLLIFGRRRAAIRGIASLLASSILANLVGKKLFGGSRPLLADIPVGRQLRKYPTSASFPSGHSASAAGFAVGVALESPLAGAVVAPIAAAVAYSRLHVGAHWVSDVAGGVALGAGVAALGRLVVPAPAKPESTAPMSGAPVDLPRSTDGAGVFIVLNSSAGNDVPRANPIHLIERRLPAARLHLMQREERLDEVVHRAMASAERPLVLGVCGGDGSVSRMAQLARDYDLPFLVLPGGTFNHFARAVGAESIDSAIDALVAGTGVRVAAADLTLTGDHAADKRGDETAPASQTVLNAASVGIYPDFVRERKRWKKQLGKWLAGLVAGIDALRHAQPVEISIGGARARVWSLFASVGRNNPEQIATMQRRSLDDEVLDVRILHARGSRLRAVASMAFGRRTTTVLRLLHLLPKRSDIESFTASQLEVSIHRRSDGLPGVTHDGELELPDGASAVLRLSVAPDALVVYAPR